ncbi:hypothetical protein Q7C36_011338 [Tachysurus vachellii]|uniref:Uncharacterized protein n=1 Tax=Tachysurus vachellii TaxID=175792 RepID=A0AA88SRX2_TACVA|nr:hypothetical protein Q7C36_011338 [Tachysurus vachellii]
MVHFLLDTIFDGVDFRPKMQKGASNPGQGITQNGSFSTQTQVKTLFNRQDHGSCSSIASCPVFMAWLSDPEEDPLPHRSSSHSSPTLQGSITNLHGPVSILSHKESEVSRKTSVSSLQNSLHHLIGSLSNLKRFSSSSVLKSPKHSFSSASTSFHSSRTSFRSSSSSVQSGSSSEDDSWETNSWSSGATCLLRSSIKQHSEEVFRVRASSGSRPKPASDSESGHQDLDRQRSDRKAESQKSSEKVLMECKVNVPSKSSSHNSSAVSAHFEKKIEAKLKFSQFLNEVTCSVLDPESLQAFGLVSQKEGTVPILPSSFGNFTHSSSLSSQQSTLSSSNLRLNGDPLPSVWESKKTNTVLPVTQWKKSVPSCKFLDSTETPIRAHEKTIFMEQQRNKGSVHTEDELKFTEARNRKKEHQIEQNKERKTLLVGPKLLQTNSVGRKHPKVVSLKTDSILRTSYCSSLPRSVNSNLVSTI